MAPEHRPSAEETSHAQPFQEPTPAITESHAHKSRRALVPAGCPALPSWVLDEREAARIARRRRLLQERAVRIHEPRVTSIAVDVAALSDQVEERRRKLESEKRKEEEFMRLAQTQDRAALLLQQREDEARTKQRDELLKFWKDEQKPERRREYDLNCRDHLISALYQLSFEGEDLEMKNRHKTQKKETGEWLRQQMEEKKQRNLQEKERERLIQLQEMDTAERARQLAEADLMCRRAQQMADEQYNKALTQEKHNAKEEEKHQDIIQEAKELRGAIFGTFLTEDPDMARSAFGPHRVITDRWKGMSPEQKKEIENIRARQVEEKKRRDDAERREQLAWEEQAERSDKAGVLLAHRDQLTRRRLEDSLVSTNTLLAKVQKEEDLRRNHRCTFNVPTEEYYSQFGVYPR